MRIIKMILGGIAALTVVAVSSFYAGSFLGSEKEKINAKQQRTEEHAAATVAVAERKAEVTEEANNVQQTVNYMPDDDVDRELRENFTRAGGG